ncbi:MAG TPA: hypothetical protein PLP17_14575, partial [Oligoflexia bacterium]|nr:hypothetical protein [Oligoflexia bacterium]
MSEEEFKEYINGPSDRDIECEDEVSAENLPKGMTVVSYISSDSAVDNHTDLVKAAGAQDGGWYRVGDWNSFTKKVEDEIASGKKVMVNIV